MGAPRARENDLARGRGKNVLTIILFILLFQVISEADFEKDGMITIEEFKRSVQGGLAN